MLDTWADMVKALPPPVTPEQRMRSFRAFLKKQSPQDILLGALGFHDFGHVDKKIAPLIADMIVMAVDTESWTKNTDEMTEIGLVSFERRAMVEVHTKKKDQRKEDDSGAGDGYEHLGDFGEELLKKITFHHLRIVETAHLKTDAKWMRGAEGNRFGHSRFVTFAEARDVLVSQFSQPVLSQDPELSGCQRPIVLIGHAMSHDFQNLKREHNLRFDWNKVGTIVREIDTQPLAKATKTWINLEVPTNEVGLETLTRTLGFDHTDPHTACNDAARCLISAIQMVLPMECRVGKEKDMRSVALNIEKLSLESLAPTWGSPHCCTRCGGRDHHDVGVRRCTIPVHCEACARFDPPEMKNHKTTHIEAYCVHAAEHEAWLRRCESAVRKNKKAPSRRPRESHPPSHSNSPVNLSAEMPSSNKSSHLSKGRSFAQTKACRGTTFVYCKKSTHPGRSQPHGYTRRERTVSCRTNMKNSVPEQPRDDNTSWW